MELSLTRQELLQVSSTCRKTMRLLPLGKKKQQKVVVGDETGTVQCFGMKKDGVVETIFKTPPGEREVGRIELAGAGGKSDASGEEPIKIFYASGGTVRGLLRKGKEFLRFNTNLTEPIRSMFVQDDHIFTGGEYIFNHFYQLKDTAFFMSNDRINDLTSEFVTGGSRAEAVLACQDRMIRVLTGSDLLYEASIDGPAVTIERYHNPTPSAGGPSQGFGPSSPSAPQVQNDGRFKELLYGTENGLIGQLLLDASMMRRGWVVDPALEGRRGKAGGVQCMCSADLTKDGMKDIMVGRDDGTVEVWGFEGGGSQPKLIFERSLQESVTSIESGLVTNGNYDEVIVSTYSGKLLAFSSEPSSSSNVAEAGQKAEKGSPQGKKGKADKKIRALRAELEKLHEQVEREKAKHGGGGDETLIAADLQFKINDKWALCPEEACYQLHIELNMPLETILLQSDVPVGLLEAESNVAIVSRTDAAGSTGLLATYRCQEAVNRLELRVRTVEGRYGSLQAYVWPRISPKTCRAASYAIKPLSLHTRLQHDVPEEQLPALNVLRISGSFTLAEVHSWVISCMPEVPARLQAEEAKFQFRNTFLGSLLLCEYRKGAATFRSDSVTSLAIVKEVVTKEATARKIQIQINVEIKDETVGDLLRRLDPMLQYQLALTNKAKLIDTLKEVKMQENDISFLAPEYVEIVENEAKIKKELKEQPGRLQFLHGIVTDLFLDKFKFKGQNGAAQAPQLQRLLQHEYSLPAMLRFFDQK